MSKNGFALLDHLGPNALAYQETRVLRTCKDKVKDAYKSLKDKAVEAKDQLKELFAESFDITTMRELPDFADALMMYISYNDKDSIKDLINNRDIKQLFTKPKKLYRIVRGKSETDYKINQYGVTSSSTKLSDSMIEEMKDMIHQYKKQGEFYLQEISSAQGIDINKLSVSFRGKQKALIKQYDTPGNQPMSALFDSLKQLKQQNEFIIIGVSAF